MRFIWISALKDLRRFRREPVTLLTWLAIPTFIAVILTVIFGPRDTRPHGTLLIADEDGGIAAKALAGAFHQGALANMLTVEKVNRDDGRKRMDKGAASALLIVPPGFTATVFAARPAKLELIRNPSQRILPGMIEETLSMFIEGAFYIQTVAGNGRNSIAPPLIQLDSKVIPEKAELPSGFAVMLLPGVLYMGLFFVVRAMSADIWYERTSGALRRMIATPATIAGFLAGKLLAVALLLAAVGAFGLLAGHLLLDLHIANLPLAVLWIAATGSGLYLLMLTLQLAASSERMANFLTNFVVLPLTMLGGGFVPLDWMPQSFARLGRLTPNGWSVERLKDILSGAWEPTAFVAVALFLAAAWLFNVRRIRSVAC
jgi:ABC-2 type transport system permease protein